MAKPIIVGISGASGALYSLGLLRALIKAKQSIYLLISKAAFEVFRFEMRIELPKDKQVLHAWVCDYCQCESAQITVFSDHEWTSPVASGSGSPARMVVCPCSSSTLAAIAYGMSDNLLERAADVVLKERGQLLLVHRETPLSAIHLHNMLAVTQAGAVVMPASPGFYDQPETIDDLVDFMVARVMIQLNLPQDLLEPWG